MQTEMLNDLVVRALLTGTLCAFFVILLDKVGLIEYVISRSTHKFITKLAGCIFCQGFWIASIVSGVAYYLTGDMAWILTPIFSAPLTRFLI